MFSYLTLHELDYHILIGSFREVRDPLCRLHNALKIDTYSLFQKKGQEMTP